MSHSDVWRGHNLGAEQFIEFLVSFGYLSKKDLAYTGTPGRGFLVEPGAGISPGPGKPSIPCKLTDVFDSGIVGCCTACPTGNSSVRCSSRFRAWSRSRKRSCVTCPTA